MAMGTERSKALHNFTMPGNLRWGNQKFLRCMNANSNGTVDRSNRRDSDPSDPSRAAAASAEQEGKSPEKFSPSSLDGRRLKVELGCSDEGIAAVREKVMLDLQTAAGKIKESIFKNVLEKGEIVAPPPQPPLPPLQVEGETVRPWNLRTRRAPVKFATESFGAAGEGGGGMRHDPWFSQTRTTAAAVRKSPAGENGGDDGPNTSGEKYERPKFAVALSKREIEEDFFAIVGRRPPRRPKKRGRSVRKQLDTTFPGLWLTEVTPDMYKVADAAP